MACRKLFSPRPSRTSPLPQPDLNLFRRQASARLKNALQPHRRISGFEEFTKDQFIEHPKQASHVEIQ